MEDIELRQILNLILDKVSSIETRLTSVEDRLTTVETNVSALQADVTEIKLVQENVTNKHLQILSEGHQLLSEKFAQIDKASVDIEDLKGGMAVIEMTTAHNWSSISALKMAR